jgi:flavin reductase (DIM6/NTAB) family NADH-FMN oxidoreductase RutF
MDNKVFHQMTYGLFLLTAQADGQDNGCIINTAIQVANNPARISIAVIKENKTCEMIRQTRRFNLSVLSTEADFALFQRFGMQSGRNVDKFAGFSDAVRTGNECYRLTRGANAWISGWVDEMYDLGSHMLFIAQVADGEVLSDAPSCSYAYYQSNIKPQKKPEGKKGWRCTVCGYIYEGETLPADFSCPICHHGPEDFEPIG